MRLTFSNDITCNAEERTITGKIVPFGNEIGYTSAGKVIFEKGSIEIPESPKPKLLLEHDAKKPLGRMVSYEETDEGIFATFRVSNTTRGNDALIEASEQLRSGLSVGVEVIDSKREGGVIKVIASKLYETSLVQAAAFKSAEVLSVAASEDEVVENPTNESEAVVENTPDTASVEPKVEAPAVEAARPTVAAPMYTKPRIQVTPALYVENTVRAALGSEEARQWIAAASDTDTTTDVPGLVPTRQLTEVINPKSTGVRPTIEAISSGTLPDAGMKFQIPRVKTAPTVAQVNEGGAFSDTQVEIEYLDVDVKKFAGMQKLSYLCIFTITAE